MLNDELGQGPAAVFVLLRKPLVQVSGVLQYAVLAVRGSPWGALQHAANRTVLLNVGTKEVLVSRPEAEPHHFRCAGQGIGALPDARIQRSPDLTVSQIPQRAEQNRKRGQPLLTVDDLAVGAVSLDQDDAAQEVRDVVAPLHREEQVLQQFTNLVRGPRIRTLVKRDLEQVVVAKHLVQILLAGLDRFRHLAAPRKVANIGYVRWSSLARRGRSSCLDA